MSKVLSVGAILRTPLRNKRTVRAAKTPPVNGRSRVEFFGRTRLDLVTYLWTLLSFFLAAPCKHTIDQRGSEKEKNAIKWVPHPRSHPPSANPGAASNLYNHPSNISKPRSTSEIFVGSLGLNGMESTTLALRTRRGLRVHQQRDNEPVQPEHFSENEDQDHADE